MPHLVEYYGALFMIYLIKYLPQSVRQPSNITTWFLVELTAVLEDVTHIIPETMAVSVVSQIHSVVERTQIHRMLYDTFVVGTCILVRVHGFHKEHPILHLLLGEVKQLRNTKL